MILKKSFDFLKVALWAERYYVLTQRFYRIWIE